MKLLIVGFVIAMMVDNCVAQSMAASREPIFLLDSSGKVAARAMNDTMMLITVSPDVVAPALIQPIYDGDQHRASGLATWASGGSVLFTSADCTSGAHV